MRALIARSERWPIRGRFAISRGSRTESVVVVVEIHDGAHRGWAECVPYARYGETVASVLEQINSIAPSIEGGIDQDALQGLLPAGAARNAVDCALWDLAAKASGERAWKLAGLPEPKPVVTAFTISLDDPEAMAAAARAASDRPLLKVKLGGDGDVVRIAAIRAAVPDARIVVDANEAWRPDTLNEYSTVMAAHGVEMIEQPLPADDDRALAEAPRPVPVCADESCHVAADVGALRDRYDMVNIKLDKTGGLTEAIALVRAAEQNKLGIMVGCMIGTSLGMAPAALLAPYASVVDLDGPLLLQRDRTPALVYDASHVAPPIAALWG